MLLLLVIIFCLYLGLLLSFISFCVMKEWVMGIILMGRGNEFNIGMCLFLLIIYINVVVVLVIIFLWVSVVFLFLIICLCLVILLVLLI